MTLIILYPFSVPYVCVTPRVMENIIKLIKLQSSLNGRLNQDTKVWNQIRRQRFKISNSG
jgi:hypothetical protein